MTPLHFMETPEEAIPRLNQQTVVIADRAYPIEHPADWNYLLNHPAVIAALAKHDYLPFWAELWPAAKMLARAIATESAYHGQSALELGCGLGLPGIVGLSMGMDITFSDYDRTALRFTERNAALNGYREIRTLLLDWRHPPDLPRFPLIFGSDLIYEPKLHDSLLNIVRMLLQPGGLFLLADPNRISAPGFEARLRLRGWSYSRERVEWEASEGSIYRIRPNIEVPGIALDEFADG